jgi:phosphatidate cytidylyltransferase
MMLPPNLFKRTITAVILLILVIAIYQYDQFIFKLFILLLGIGMFLEMMKIIRHRYILTSYHGLRWVAFSICYCVIPVLCTAYIMDHNALIYLIAIVIATDIGGYIFGSLIGGPKLAPQISPKKTWSGTIGGILCAILIAWLIFPQICILLAISLSITAQIGDLLESSIKRHFKVKDSGNILPGHGGILDRMDSMITAAIILTIVIMLNPRMFL